MLIAGYGRMVGGGGKFSTFSRLKLVKFAESDFHLKFWSIFIKNILGIKCFACRIC